MSAAGVLWLPLGELLVERGLLSTVQLELALAEQRRTGLRLGEVLVSMGYVSEAALARMLLEQVGLTAPPEPPVAELEPEPEPEPEPEQAPEPEPGPFAEPEAVVIEGPVPPEPVAKPEPEPTPEPVIVRMEDASRDRGRWWSRNGGKARVTELEKVLSDFEQRSRAIEADIMRVRATLRSLRDAG